MRDKELQASNYELSTTSFARGRVLIIELDGARLAQGPLMRLVLLAC